MIASSGTLDSLTSEAPRRPPVAVADLPAHLTRTVAAAAARPPVVYRTRPDSPANCFDAGTPGQTRAPPARRGCPIASVVSRDMTNRPEAQ
ncbi:hypothetical protein GCM10027290_43340 [Micromonospora sonneratiae]|uniref:Uncharacterized protein n=1 Tax=Micromonospora sonneratiae TaxID=1184706 RepID=A0ABW3YFY5_9ACTN